MNQQALTKYKANAFDLKGIIQRKRLDLVGSPVVLEGPIRGPGPRW